MDSQFRKLGDVFLAPSAVVTGDVCFGVGVNLWYNVVVRGDVAPVTIGDYVNLQDGAIVHCDFGVPNVIDAGCSVGHGAILHGIHVGADTLIGMGAILLGGSDIGEQCIVAAGCVVPPNTIVPPRSLVMGVPGKIVRSVTEEEVELTRANNRRYRELAKLSFENTFEFPPRGPA
jgi:carbonic anhydrase/acetyltransferase-like protein (isoleucine patch superfamily)